MKILTSLAIAMLFFCTVGAAHAQIPRTLSYQGVLTDATGKPRPNADYQFTFRLYDVATGGTALWAEQKTLPVNNGLFSTALGDQVAFGTAVKFDRQYWLGIQVGNEPELSPRIALTSVGYSMSSLRADTAVYALSGTEISRDTTWATNGFNVYRLNGNIGIGTSNPVSRLDLGRLTGIGIRLTPTGTSFSYNGYYHHDLLIGGYLKNDGRSRNFISFGYTQDPYREFSIGSASDADFTTASFVPYFTVASGGNVGIGTTSPQEKLEVLGNVRLPYGHNLQLWTSQGRGGIHWSNNSTVDFLLYQDGTSGDQRMLNLVGSGRGDLTFAVQNLNVGIGTTNPTAKLEVVGHTKTSVLEITGGADLAEPFPTSESESLPLGAVVVIDENNPGHLKLSREPYDKSVAGIVSGAGGINPGLTLRQEGVMEGGQLVALTGKVYALATTANGPIKPGDLLTTSDVAGHAMKATDRELSHGAVIGKAMSRLEQGEGLVLVLVNLQ